MPTATADASFSSNLASDVIINLVATEAADGRAVDLVVLVPGKASEVVPPASVPTKTTCQHFGQLQR